MKLREIGEFGLIERVAKRAGGGGEGVVVGGGDDAAVFKPSRGSLTVATTDALIEKVHFDLSKASFRSVGRKALCSNISDCVSMGARPRHFLVTIALPSRVSVAQVDELYDGMLSLARKYRISLAGGDTVSSPGPIVISITLLGEVKKKNLMLRSGARPGDLICVTGKLGDPRFGLGRYPRVREALSIAESRLATSMIDNSDGLARCLIEICRMSRVGARVDVSRIPLASTLDLALYGGEDYELVFTVPGSRLKKLPKKCAVIGEITRISGGIKLIYDSGREKNIKSGGYQHFDDQ